MSEAGAGFECEATASVTRAPRVQVGGHVVCRGPDGEVKWESDIEPVVVGLADTGAGSVDELRERLQSLVIDAGG